MSAPLTKAKEAVGRRSRLEILQAAIQKDEAALEAARAKVGELAERETAAVREAKRADPAGNPYKLGSPAQTARAEAEKLDRTIAGFEKGLLALRLERDEAAGELAEKRLAEAILRARKLRDEERDFVGKAGALLPSLLKLWHARLALLEDRRALVESVRAESLVVAAARPDLAAKWEEAAASELAPTAFSFVSFVNALLEAALADRPDVEAEYAAADELNARRREMARRDPGGGDDLPMVPKPVIRIDPLQELVPDLREEARSFDPTVAGPPLARPDEEGEIEGLRESGFGLSGVLYTADGNARVPWRRSPGPPEAA